MDVFYSDIIFNGHWKNESVPRTCDKRIKGNSCIEDRMLSSLDFSWRLGEKIRD